MAPAGGYLVIIDGSADRGVEWANEMMRLIQALWGLKIPNSAELPHYKDVKL